MVWIKCHPSLKELFSERRVNIHFGEEIPLQLSFLNSSVNTNAYYIEHVKEFSNKYINYFLRELIMPRAE